MPEPQKHNAKGKAANAKECIFHDSIYMQFPERINL